MRMFGATLKMHIKEQFQYRTSTLSGMITQFCFGLMQIALFTAFLKSGSSDFTVSQMISYIWLQQIFFALFKYWDICKTEISNNIKNGDIAYQLIRPCDLYNYWYSLVFSKSIGATMMRGIPLAIITLILPFGLNLSLPSSVLGFVLFVVSAALGAFLVTAIVNVGYIISLYTLSSNGVFSFIVAIAGLLSGQVVPIPMLPMGVQKVLNFFPFRYVSDLPFRLYIGNIQGTDALIQIAIQFAWLVVIVGLSKLVMRKKIKNIVVQGG